MQFRVSTFTIFTKLLDCCLHVFHVSSPGRQHKIQVVVIEHTLEKTDSHVFLKYGLWYENGGSRADLPGGMVVVLGPARTSLELRVYGQSLTQLTIQIIRSFNRKLLQQPLHQSLDWQIESWSITAALTLQVVHNFIGVVLQDAFPVNAKTKKSMGYRFESRANLQEPLLNIFTAPDFDSSLST